MEIGMPGRGQVALDFADGIGRRQQREVRQRPQPAKLVREAIRGGEVDVGVEEDEIGHRPGFMVKDDRAEWWPDRCPAS